MRHFRFVGTACLVLCLAACSGDTGKKGGKDGKSGDKKEASNAEKLVGTWELVKNSKGNVEGLTVYVEFTKDGKMAVKYTPKEKDAATTALNGKFKADGDKIDYTIEDGAGGTRGEILTIKKMTDDELVTVDPDGIQEEFKRVKPKKDEKKPEDKK